MLININMLIFINLLLRRILYKKTIKGRNNKYVYYYTNVRKDGKVKNIFLSSDKEPDDYNSSFSSLLINSAVVNTLTNDCCLRCVSLDQIGELVNNANARKSISSGSGITSNDFL